MPKARERDSNWAPTCQRTKEKEGTCEWRRDSERKNKKKRRKKERKTRSQQVTVNSNARRTLQTVGSAHVCGIA
jgi:hypothetical protein